MRIFLARFLAGALGGAAALWSACPPAAAEPWLGNTSLSLGVRFLDEKEWEPVEVQPGAGLRVDFRRHQWPIAAVVGLTYTGDEGSQAGLRVDASVLELRLGVEKAWEKPIRFIPLSPHVGGGASVFRVAAEMRRGGNASESDQAWALGAWMGGGVRWSVSERVWLGGEVVWSKARIGLFDERFDPGGVWVGATLGYGWDPNWEWAFFF